MARRVILSALLVTMALVICADLLNSAICPDEDVSGGCDGLSDAGGQNDEKGCDHCVACSVAHGHFHSVQPAAIALVEPPNPFALALMAHPRHSDPRPQDIFHPPLFSVL